MQHLKPNKGQPTAREQALARRVFNMSDILGMRRMSPIVFETEEKPEEPKLPISE